MEDLIEKLKKEHKELADKIDKLEKFFQGDVYRNLDTYHKNLLINQHIGMCTYYTCLAHRILDLSDGTVETKNA